MNPSRIATARLYRTAEIIWALSSVDCEQYQSQLKLDSVHQVPFIAADCMCIVQARWQNHLTLVLASEKIKTLVLKLI